MIVLDDVDKAILAELARDPFASVARVAKAVDGTIGTVSARLAVLHRERVSQVLAALDMTRLDQSFCLLHVRVRGRPVADVAQDLAARRLVLIVTEFAEGANDLLVGVRFKTFRDLDQTLYEDIARIPGVYRYSADVVLDVPVLRAEYLTFGAHYQPAGIDEQLEMLAADLPAGLCDETDVQIIAHLLQNAHQSINSIARALRINAGTARYRINNLKASGLLLFTRVTDRQAMGIDTAAYLELEIDAARVDPIVAALREKSWLHELFRCAGRTMLTGFVASAGIDELLRLRQEEILSIEGVDTVRLSRLNRSFKVDYRWTRRIE